MAVPGYIKCDIPSVIALMELALRDERHAGDAQIKDHKVLINKKTKHAPIIGRWFTFEEDGWGGAQAIAGEDLWKQLNSAIASGMRITHAQQQPRWLRDRILDAVLAACQQRSEAPPGWAQQDHAHQAKQVETNVARAQVLAKKGSSQLKIKI